MNSDPRTIGIVNGLDSTAGLPTVVGSSVFRPKFDGDYLSRLRRGGIFSGNLTVTWPGDDFAVSTTKIVRWRALSEQLRSGMTIALTADDVEEARDSGKFALILGSQDASMIGGTLEGLVVFHSLGLRVLQLTYQRRNLIGDGCGERTDCGISMFGRRVVEEMNRIGILIDLSHCGPMTTLEAIEASTSPVAITHSSAASLCDHMRAKSDEILVALAKNDGVIGVCSLSQYLKKDGFEVGTTLNDYLDHIDYIVRLIGEDHVALGLDNHEDYAREEYDAFTRSYPELQPRNYENRVVGELQSVVGAQLIIEGLRKRGYGEEVIEKIAHGNFLRVFRAACGSG